MEGAIALLQQAVEANPDLADAHFNLAIVYGRLNRLDAAMAAMREVIRRHPDDAEALMRLGGWLFDRGLYADACETYERAVTLHMDSGDAWLKLAQSYDAAGKPRAAVAAYRRVLGLLGRDDPAVLGALFRAAIRAEEGSAAVEAARKLRVFQPGREGFLTLGEALLTDGQPDAAAREFQMAAALAPTSVRAYAGLASAYARMGQAEAAAESFQRAIRLQPPVTVRIERPVIDGKQLVAIKVQEFEQTPVICVKDGPVKDPKTGKRYFYEGNLIIRTVAAKTVVIRTADDMHALIRLAVTKTSNTLLQDVRRILEGEASASVSPPPYERELAAWVGAFAERTNEWKRTYSRRGWFSFLLIPDRVVSDERDHSTLKKLVQRSYVELKGLQLPSCYPDQSTTLQNLPRGIQGRLDLGDYQEIWQLHDSGAFMYGRLLLYRQHDQVSTVIPFEEIVRLVTLAVLFAQRLYQDLSPDGQIEYRFALAGIKDHQLGSFDRFLFHPLVNNGWRAAVEPIEAGGSAAVLDLRSAWRSIARQVSAKLIKLFNWDNPEQAIDAQLDEIEGKRR